ncbi:S41 family peptidase [Paenibacillus motobuensis]|uniref:S41 family peptidase n=1 Tax=Paenibacillus TaxID=44249 RepID=UPI00203B083F|nr:MULTISPECIES: S41 family peptidase [Paenibacillus]MCM3041265.1 S41 family peptidase [Paenibacillus lutimineralis]MCM3648369.1 S41 family peptidase [Paenibacillus motobuensis]
MSVIGTIDSVKWLTVYELVMCIISLFVLTVYAVPIKKYSRWFDFLPSVGVLAAIASILSGDMTLLALIIESLTLIVFLCTIRRLLKPKVWTAPKKTAFRIVRSVICICGVVPIVIALANAGVLRYNPVSDFSGMSYSKAFVAMNERLSREYPFGEWKKIDWNERRSKYEPIFKQAEKDKDFDLYYKTLREYLSSLRDGHIKIVNDNVYDGNTVFKKEVGGGFGLSTVQLDNGKVFVSLVLENSPAAKSGIKLGAEIVAWGGKTGKEAFDQTTWSENNMATDEVKRFNQGRFMVRAPIGKEIQVEFRNWGESEPTRTKLMAYDDQFETLKKTKIKLTQADLDAPPIEGEILGNGYGYVKIKHFLPNSNVTSPEKSLADLLKMFQDRHVKGLIIDLRNNPGGEDQLAANLAGFFVKEMKHYEYVSYYNRYTGKFELNRNEVVKVKPAKPNFDGPVAILINSSTGSSGEGMPLVLKGVPNVKIVGFTSTAGSFGLMSSPIEIKMPEGYVIQFPDGRSLNQNKKVQGDADQTGVGGAVPDIKIPLNEETFKASMMEGQDVELKYAIEAMKK